MTVYWTQEDERKSMQEGWFFTTDHIPCLVISRVDDPLNRDYHIENPRFTSSDEALAFVIQAAALGSRRHLLALYLVGRSATTMLNIELPKILQSDAPEMIEEDAEDSGLILDHAGVRVYWTEKDCCFSTRFAATQPHMHCDDERAFCWEDLDYCDDTSDTAKDYAKQYPNDYEAQVLAYNIDLGYVTAEGYAPMSTSLPPTRTEENSDGRKS